MEEFIETNLTEGINWNELEMNKNVFTSSNVFISSLGLTPNYNMVFLIVKMGGVDDSITNG